ncbi:IS3 family transposase [Thomasclavelia ramosa]|uniref:IS3 family transposase n=1 Tax=Thomasclavelia ramosa TaxID=1547 RepID=UPI00300DCD2D
MSDINRKTVYKRNFTTTGCNQKWSTDISEFHIAAGKLYLSPILDLHNREIVSYDISASPSFIQITNMLDKAFSKYDNLEGLIMHSDQGWQYQMQNYKKKLNDKRIRQSMSRKGNCLDNSPIENFFGKMKNEMFYGYEYTFKTFNQLKWKHDLIVIWCLMFIISLIKIINQNANTWWLPWMWGVVSLINVFVLFREIKKLKQI